MKELTAGEVYRTIKDEEQRQFVEALRRRFNPTVAEVMRDVEEQQLRDLVRLRQPEIGDAVSRASAPLTADVPASVLQPAGGSWPHKKGAPWTEAERVALFIMRHRDKMTGERLADIAGCTRQRVTELIGPLRPYGALSDVQAADGWKPSVGVLHACAAPLQPLQNVVAQLAS